MKKLKDIIPLNFAFILGTDTRNMYFGDEFEPKRNNEIINSIIIEMETNVKGMRKEVVEAVIKELRGLLK